jgi:16S rRNA (guanine966-N2)-methyltransferase
MNRPSIGQVRIIAGSLRGSKLPVADRPGLRPTGDRARETLFNWLQQAIAGRRVIDLFAGSGALGFEAVSRGAADVLMLERDSELARSLRDTAARLKTEAVRVEAVDALAWLGRTPEPRFDLAFIDPPFEANLWQAAADAIAPWLAEGARVHVELAPGAAFSPPRGWELQREAATRGTRHQLYRVERGRADTLGGDSTGTRP